MNSEPKSLSPSISTASYAPSVSVVINTDGRAKSLRKTIESFRQVTYPLFELCVVHGPTSDGTKELVEHYTKIGMIKSGTCPERNLSKSRNIGIALASGDIVAFIDDDGIPEPEWLSQLVAPFDDSRVGGSGGLVYDPTGYTYQYLYAACDRLGNARLDLTGPADEYNFPFSSFFPYVQGTNSAFRRSALVHIGGFDEEYEFYLDETDVCCRIIDYGLKIQQLPNAAVHHKFLPSHIRNSERVTIVKYPIIKNKIYFSLVNNQGHSSISQAILDANQFIDRQRADLEFHVRAGRLNPGCLWDFEKDVEQAWRDGLCRGLSGQRRTRPTDFFRDPPEFVAFPALTTEGPRRCLVFLSQNYPPEHSGGGARYTHDIARAIASLGHTVHVLTQGADFNRVDLDDGVWVHRIVPKDQGSRCLPTGELIPARIWNYSATMLEEIYRIGRFRRVDVVEGVGWDAECIATVLDGHFPSATNIITSLHHWLETHEELRNDKSFMESFGNPLLAAEKYIFWHSPGIVAASKAISRSIEERYDVTFAPDRIGHFPHGMLDMSLLPQQMPKGLKDATSEPRLAVLFVGRLELRKGIDVLLDAVPTLTKLHPNVEFWIAGDDTLEIGEGITAKQKFLSANVRSAIRDRVKFLGRVDEDELHWLYANCDILVAPSRFESFGLIFLEAMMFGKPSVGCRAGGMPEVLEDSVSGFLAEPGDVTTLAAALDRLISDAGLRDRMGKAARKRFDEHFEASIVARQRVAFLSTLIRCPVDEAKIQWHGRTRIVGVGLGERGRLIAPGGSLEFVTTARAVYITFWMHDWSGMAEVRIDGRLVQEIDLFSPVGHFRTVSVSTQKSQGVSFALRRSERKNDLSHGMEVIVYSIEESSPGEQLYKHIALRHQAAETLER